MASLRKIPLQLPLIINPLLVRHHSSKVYDRGPEGNFLRKIKRAKRSTKPKTVTIKSTLLDNLMKSEEAVKQRDDGGVESKVGRVNTGEGGGAFKNILSQMNISVPSTEDLRKKMGMPSKPFKLSETPGPPEVTHPVSTSFTEGKRLGIFNKPTGPTETPPPQDSWTFYEEDRMEQLKTIEQFKPSTNAFDKIIEESSQVWSYPIDNEIVNEGKEEVGFEQHVFMNQYLDECQFPKSGPERQFMELVATGLSMNPYYSAEEKREHIQWYKEYFEK